MPPLERLRAGIITVIAAALLSWGTTLWLKTRTFDPVNMPVVMGTGKIQTVQFEINLREVYQVDLSVDHDSVCSRVGYTDERWRVYRLRSGTPKKRELQASSEDPRQEGWFIYGFGASPGKYELEWEAPDEPACLNEGHPRLHIFTDSEGYRRAVGLIQFVCVPLGAAGIILVLRGLASWLLGSLWKRRSLRIFPDMVLRNVFSVRRHRPSRLVAELPHFGLFWGCILIILMFMVIILPSRLKFRGLLVNFGNTSVAVWQESPSTETLGVYIDCPGGFYVNGKRLAREELRAKLNEELGKRIVWTVYLEADEQCAFGEAVYAMDTIQGLGARLIWLTPRTRAELNLQKTR
jgi:biopolymer transport protein ExbD